MRTGSGRGGGVHKKANLLNDGFSSGYQKFILTFRIGGDQPIEHHNVAKTMYLNGHSTKEISDKIGVSTRQVRNILRSKGVTIRGKRRTNGRKVNEDFFKTWSNEMAYVLGFVITDGNISNSEEHTSELQSRGYVVCRLLLEKKK